MPGPTDVLTAHQELPVQRAEADRYTINYNIARLAQLHKQSLAHSRCSVSVGGMNEYTKGYYGITVCGGATLLERNARAEAQRAG